MPKIVDAEERRRQIYEAVLAQVIRGGVGAATLRQVADAAGINIGSVRHFAGSHIEMLRGAAEHFIAGVAARIADRAARFETAAPAEYLDIAVDVLAELVPLDDERRDEAALWLAFAEYARVHGDIDGVFTRLAEGVRTVAAQVLSGLPPSPDRDAATESLACVLDGLAIAALNDPAAYPPERIRAILRWQVAKSYA